MGPFYFLKFENLWTYNHICDNYGFLAHPVSRATELIISQFPIHKNFLNNFSEVH